MGPSVESCSMMMSAMSGMMPFIGLGVLALIGLGIAALVKYLFVANKQGVTP
ncbi:hypothetical protein [Litchfieldella xinjiangensis]|uniref:hypothetical protein n=1 Tax=Litchfieldella xinjiangensis TaxID=1166948 RepID=UPI000AD357E4|nr:hypothetical protein [Halomonas xinjiangensis]